MVTLSDASDPQPTFTAPIAGATLQFQLQVTDNGVLAEEDRESDTDSVTINVNAPPSAPTTGPDQTVQRRR